MVILTIKKTFQIMRNLGPYILRASGAGLAFLSGIVLSRYMGAHDSGIYYVSLNVISIVAVIANFGFNTVIVKESSDKYNGIGRGKEILNSSLSFSFWMSVVTITVALFIASIIGFNESMVCVLIMSPAIYLMSSINSLSSFLQARQNFSSMIITQSLALPLMIIIFTLILWKEKIFLAEKFIMISIVYLVCSSIVYAYGISAVRKITKISLAIQKPIPRFDTKKYAAINIIIILMAQGVILLAGHGLSFTEMSKVMAAQKIAMLFNFITTTIIMVYIPKLIDSYNNDLDKFKVYFNQCKRKVLVINSFLVLVVFVFSDQIINVYGESFLGAGLYLKILVIFQLVNAYCAVSGALLLYIERQGTLLKIYAISLSVSAFSALIFPSVMDNENVGVSFAIGFSATVINIISLIQYDKKHKLAKKDMQ